jgi:hypothetical protein
MINHHHSVLQVREIGGEEGGGNDVGHGAKIARGIQEWCLDL